MDTQLMNESIIFEVSLKNKNRYIVWLYSSPSGRGKKSGDITFSHGLT